MKQIHLDKYFMVLVVLALSLSGCTILGFGQEENVAASNINIITTNTIISEGNLAPREFRYLTFLRAGKVADILVKKGDAVTAGQVIARLGDREQVEANLASAELELLSVQQNYDELIRTSKIAQSVNQQNLFDARMKVIAAERSWSQIDTKDFQNRIDDGNITLQDALKVAEDAQTEFDKYKDLSTDNPNYIKTNDALEAANRTYQEARRKYNELVLQRELAKTNLELANASLVEAEFKNNLTKDGPDTTKLAILEARLKSAKSQLASVRLALTTFEIIAPFQGEIIEINILQNEQVGISTLAFLIADVNEWFVETSDLTELKVVDIEINDEVELTADAMPDKKMVGMVTEISESFKLQSGDIVYKVRIKVIDPAPLLRWGMTFQISFTK